MASIAGEVVCCCGLMLLTRLLRPPDDVKILSKKALACALLSFSKSFAGIAAITCDGISDVSRIVATFTSCNVYHL